MFSIVSNCIQFNGSASLTFEAESTLDFSDESASGDKVLALIDKGDPTGDTPVIENNSDNIELETDNGVVTVPHKHSAVKVPEVAATCVKDGNIEYWYCADCDKYFSDEDLTKEITLEETIVKAKGHGETKVINAKEATCAQEGYTGDTVCTECGTVISFGKAIPKTAHNFKDGKCTVCGAADPNYQQSQQQTDGNQQAIKTGEESNMLVISLIIIAACAGIAATVMLGSRRKTKH